MNTQLTDERLLSLLEQQRQRFVDGSSLLDGQGLTRLERSTRLIQLDLATIKDNAPKRRAHDILRNMWINVPSVFVLCAVATTHDKLGTLKSVTYMAAVSTWWHRVGEPANFTRAIEAHRRAGHLPPLPCGPSIPNPRPPPCYPPRYRTYILLSVEELFSLLLAPLDLRQMLEVSYSIFGDDDVGLVTVGEGNESFTLAFSAGIAQSIAQYVYESQCMETAPGEEGYS